jgi:RNA recognition motif-containing protein
MKSPQFLTVSAVAVIFAIVGYFSSGFIGVEPVTVAISLFIGAFFAPLLGNSKSSTSSEEQEIKTLYVGNLPYRANESTVRELFSEHGFVHSVRLMKDKHTGKRRGFGFVEMSADNIEQVISTLNDMEFQQRTLKVREAKERPERTDNIE